MDLLAQYELEHKIGISIVSEPHNIPDNISWTGNLQNTVAIHVNYEYVEGTGILIRKGQYGVALKWKRFKVIACYISPNVSDNEFSRFIRELDSMVAELKCKDIIIAGDFNSKDRMWGSKHTDSRGEKLARWAANWDLRLINEGSSPTCVRHHGSSIVDLTWSTADIQGRINNWRVLDVFTYSDHMYISYILNFNDSRDINISIDVSASVNMYSSIRKKYIKWSHKKMDVDIFKETLEWICTERALHIETVEEAASWLKEAYTNACDMSMPRLKKVVKNQVYWWNSEIAELRTACKQARKKWQRLKRKRNVRVEQILLKEEAYREIRASLRKEINKAKAQAWDELIHSIDSDPWGLPYKLVLQKLRRTSPGITEMLSLEVLDNTIRRLFPYDVNWSQQVEELPSFQDTWKTEDEVTPAEIYEFLCKRSVSNTAPGEDGLKALYLKKTPAAMIDKITECLGICMKQGLFPDDWKRAILILIPKEKLDVKDPKVRPICLLSELGKLMERVIVARMEKWIEDNPEYGLMELQYGFRRMRSTCDALYYVQRYIQEAIKQDKIVIATSLDISNAFNSIKWRHIRQMLKDRNFPIYIRRIINSYLSNRYVQFLSCEGKIITKEVTAGVPQGSVLGPTLWNLTYDWALRVRLENDTVVIGYADDTLILAKADDVSEGIARMNLQISKTLNRIRALDLQVSEHKTEVVIFKRKRRKVPEGLNIQVGREAVPVKRALKYLGIYLDQDWSFKEHIDFVEGKAARISQQLGRLMPNLKGPREKKRRLYASTINSVLLYGAPIWSEVVGVTPKLKQQLLRVQRVLAIRVIAGYRSISADAALVLARMAPIQLQAAYLRRVYLRVHDLKQLGDWDRKIEREVKEEERILMVRQWEILLGGNNIYGKRTCNAIRPHLNIWINRQHGEMTYRITQLLTGHGCFNTYLFRIGKERSPVCSFCNNEEDSSEHTVQVCERWSDERRTLVEELGPDLSFTIIVQKICATEGAWKAFALFAENVMREKEEAERLREYLRGRDPPEDSEEEEATE